MATVREPLVDYTASVLDRLAILAGNREIAETERPAIYYGWRYSATPAFVASVIFHDRKGG